VNSDPLRHLERFNSMRRQYRKAKPQTHWLQDQADLIREVLLCKHIAVLELRIDGTKQQVRVIGAVRVEILVINPILR